MKMNISTSILLDDSANTQTKRMKSLEETHTVLKPVQQRRKTLHEISEQTWWRETGAPKRRFCSLCSGASEVFQHALPWEMPIQEHLTQNFWLWEAVKCLEKPRKWFGDLANTDLISSSSWSLVLWDENQRFNNNKSVQWHLIPKWHNWIARESYGQIKTKPWIEAKYMCRHMDT